jgi:hypothetical protein
MKIKLNLDKSRAAQIKAKQKATATLWRTGRFTDLLLNSYQRDMLKAYDEADSVMFFLLCSRRIGKTWVECTIALRQCLAHPGTRALFLSTTTDQVEEICEQTFSLLLESCPPELKPDYQKKTHKYIFPNGSEIRVKGLDKAGGDSIRGVKAHLVIFDEACFMRGLNNIIDSVVMPMVIATNGRILFGSTPPSSPGHDSIDIIRKCEKVKSLCKIDIMASLGVLYNQRQIDEFIRQAGGSEASVCRREYFTEIVTEMDLAVFPACTETHIKTLIKGTDTPTYPIDRYVSMDIGFRDLTVILFGYWDYPRATLVIEDEVVMPKNNADTDSVAKAIIQKERELWGQHRPKKRICDTDPRMIVDLRKLSDIKFIATKKDKKHAQINQTNLMFLNQEIEINPRCETLIDHCRYGVWKESFTEYQRTKSMGHFDAIDALVYMVRNIARNHNPIPENTYSVHTHIDHDQMFEKKEKKHKLNNLFNRRRR